MSLSRLATKFLANAWALSFSSFSVTALLILADHQSFI